MKRHRFRSACAMCITTRRGYADARTPAYRETLESHPLLRIGSPAFGTNIAGTIAKSQPKRQRMPAQLNHIFRIAKADISIYLDITSRRAEEQGR